ncbi:MAG TPA: hypothetical protein O0X50_03370, partial [Methanocorpusculum sp.]|nr:hypothetical protein [Methanocorpusculum sp.]
PQYPPQQQYQQAPQYPPQQQYQQPPQYQQASPYAYAESPRVPGPNEAVCDECGQIYPKSEMRKCKKCGAVLCPKCRGKHKCKKSSKKNTAGELYPEASYVHEDSSKSYAMNAGETSGKKQKKVKQPKEKKAGKKMSRRTLIIIIAVCVLVAGLIVAFLMIKAQNPSDLPEWLANIVVKIFPQG